MLSHIHTVGNSELMASFFCYQICIDKITYEIILLYKRTVTEWSIAFGAPYLTHGFKICSKISFVIQK